jgi:peroxiredoxin Q/BCP
MAVQVGDVAPDFVLKDQKGTEVRLSDLTAAKAVVLYFYPSDETPGCTVEACTFRDSYEAFKEAGAEVVGVSSNSTDSHESFAAHHRLPFILLADEGGKVREQYDVPRSMFGFVDGRVTYVIDRKGVVKHLFNSLVSPKKHVAEALAALKS